MHRLGVLDFEKEGGEVWATDAVEENWKTRLDSRISWAS